MPSSAQPERERQQLNRGSRRNRNAGAAVAPTRDTDRKNASTADGARTASGAESADARGETVHREVARITGTGILLRHQMPVKMVSIQRIRAMVTPVPVARGAMTGREMGRHRPPLKADLLDSGIR